MSTSFEFQPSNPFSTQFTAPNKVLYRFVPGPAGVNASTLDTQLDGLLAKLQSNRRSLVVGPHGTGKSTLLHTFLPKLQANFSKVAFHRLSSDPSVGLRIRMRERSQMGKRIRDVLQQLPSDGLLVIDGWEQLGRLVRWRISSLATAGKLSVLATTHSRLSGWEVLLETKSSPKMIRSLAGDLLRDQPHELKKMIDDHLKQCRVDPMTNVRELWFDLYDMVENADTYSTKFHA